MKNFISGIALCFFAVLVALPANAGFVGHTIGGSAVQGGPNLFSPDTAVIQNAEYDIFGDLVSPNIEFQASGIVGWLDGNSSNPIGISIIADFYDDNIYGPVLDLRISRTDGSGGDYTISGLTLTFSSMNYVDPPDDHFLLESVNAIPFDYNPDDYPPGVYPPGYHETLQGLAVSHTANDPYFSISFNDFEVDEGREDRFQLSYVASGVNPPDPIVPLPTPLAMAALGMLSLALRRKFS